MKIVFLQDDFPPESAGGAGFSTYELAKGMKKSGHDVYVITTCRKVSGVGYLEYDGLKVYRILSNYSSKWRSFVGIRNRNVIRKLDPILRNLKPDIVHVNNVHFHLSFHSIKIARRHAQVVVFTARDTMTICFGKLQTKQYLDRFDYHMSLADHVRQAKKRWNPLRNILIRRYLRSADQIFTVSHALEMALEANGIENVETLHTGIDVEAWKASDKAVQNFTKKHGLEGKQVILFGGRISEPKGGGKAVEAMEAISKTLPNSILLIAGPVDAYAEAMKESAAKAGISDRLVFTNWIQGEEMRSAYASANVVWVPSICFDSFPRAVIEAMACGKPVIATCYGGASEIVIDGETGYIVNPLHPEQIAEKTIDLLKNPDKARRFGEAGYERVKNEFNLENTVKQYLERYRQLLAKRSNI